MIEHGANVSAVDQRDETPIFRAAELGKIDQKLNMIGHFWEISNCCEVDYLNLFCFSFIWSGHVEVVKVLLQHGADVNATANKYMSPLLAAIPDGKIGLLT